MYICFNPSPSSLSTWFMDDPFAETKKWSKRARILAVSMQDTSAFCNKKFGRWREGVGGHGSLQVYFTEFFWTELLKSMMLIWLTAKNHNVIWHNVVRHFFFILFMAI